MSAGHSAGLRIILRKSLSALIIYSTLTIANTTGLMRLRRFLQGVQHGCRMYADNAKVNIQEDFY
jgi:hypothetical protein